MKVALNHSSSMIAAQRGTPSTSTMGPRGRWREYQGLNNWSGLLDPLNPILRSEILRYGEFVQAAYTAFDCDPSSPTYATCPRPKHSLLPNSTGYSVTKNLHASSGARLPKWAEQASPDWMTRKSSWIGYIAVCTDEQEMDRLGRRDVVIALRGTVTCMEWVENLRATLTHLPPSATARGSSPDPMVERGFWSLFTSSSGLAFASLRDQIREEIRRLVDRYGGCHHKPLSLTITGHSLGAALAVLTAYDITASLADNSPMVTVVSFGGPRVGNSSFRRRLEEQGSRVLRIVNTQDIVTKVPGFVVDQEVDDDDEKEVSMPRWLLSKTGWVYADIGQELRVRGERTANVAACHDLNVYLNLVNEVSSTCPLRAQVEQSFRWPFLPLQTANTR